MPSLAQAVKDARMTTAKPKIVICGAGIAGIAAAYHLAVEHGCENVVLIEVDSPLSLTSDKSTEAYRNWWPDPDGAMTAFMNRSIDLLETIARQTDNRINLNRRGYLFASADPLKMSWLHEKAQLAEQHGAGPLRLHDSRNTTYQPAANQGFETELTGVDIITEPSLIRQHFPYLAQETCVVGHARRAGWLSAQQLGMVMLEAARKRGVQLIKGRMSGVETRGGHVTRVHVEQTNGRQSIETTHVVLAAGPMLKTVAAGMGVDLPIYGERHQKISLADATGAVPRHAPMLIWLDSQRLPWSDDERAVLMADAATRWLTAPFPSGVHGRPDGGASSSTLLVLFNYENNAAEIVFPLPDDSTYADIALRGMSTMVPSLKAAIDKGARPYMDGGYYIKTKENRALIGPTSVGGVFVSGAYSGFGIMAACAGGDLIARHVLSRELPLYAPAFMLSRYQNSAYLARLENWGDGGQL
jgi:glycine/D-amino acid oxidase-like deaminating enzyme